MERISKIQALPDIGRDFIGVAGQHDTYWKGEPLYEILSWTEYEMSLMNTKPGVLENRSRQIMLSGKYANAIGRICQQTRNRMVTVAGRVWEVPRDLRCPGETETEATYRILAEAAEQDDLTDIARLGGDFVAVVQCLDEVVLIRSLTSGTQIFYRSKGTSLFWSCNPVDLVDDPYGNVDRLALASLCCYPNGLPYPDVKLLGPGMYIRFRGGSINTLSFDNYETSINTNLKTLEEWGECARETIIEAVRKQIRPFRKIALPLSGGIDSSAMAYCLAYLGVDTTCYHFVSSRHRAADESEYARMVAEHLGLPYRELLPDTDDQGCAQLLNVSWRFRIPHGACTYSVWQNLGQIIKGDADCILHAIVGDLFAGCHEFHRLPQELFRNPRFAISYLLQLAAAPVSIKKLLKILMPKPDWAKDLVRRLPHSSDLGTSLKQLFYVHPNTDRELCNVGFLNPDLAEGIVNNRPTYEGEDGLGETSFNLNVHFPARTIGITPFRHRAVMDLIYSIPDIHRHVFYGGLMTNKAVERQAFLGYLPAEVVRRSEGALYEHIVQDFAVKNGRMFRELLGAGSCVEELGIVDSSRLEAVLTDLRELAGSSVTLTTMGLIEIWLRCIKYRKRPTT